MKAFLPIVMVVAALAVVPLFVQSNVVLNFLIVALMIALAGQGWNILGGYGGQYSFGHAAFFGSSAYATAWRVTARGAGPGLAMVSGVAVSLL